MELGLLWLIVQRIKESEVKLDFHVHKEIGVPIKYPETSEPITDKELKVGTIIAVRTTVGSTDLATVKHVDGDEAVAENEYSAYLLEWKPKREDCNRPACWLCAIQMNQKCFDIIGAQMQKNDKKE